MPRIRHQQNLKLGSLEFTRMQDLQNENAWALFDVLIKTYGLIVTMTGETTYGTEWQALKDITGGLKIKAGRAIVKSDHPRPISLLQDVVLSKPALDGTYTAVISYQEKNTEEGTVSLTQGSATVTGTGTKFKSVLGPGRRIIVEGAAYTVLTVESDTSLTLESAYTGTSLTGKAFSTGGWFYGTAPASVDDNCIYFYDDYKLEIKASALEGEYKIAEVTVSGGEIITVTDKRTDNIFTVQSNFAGTTGTASENFKVGGRYVLTEPDIPAAIQNFRIADIASTKSTVDSTMANSIAVAYQNGLDSYLNVKLKWGYDNITGFTSGTNEMHITTAGLAFTKDQLKDLYIHIFNVSKTFRITGNNATSGGDTLVTLINEDGTSWDGKDISGNYITIASDNPAWIHFDADSYEIAAIPCSGDPGIPEYDYAGRIEALANYGLDVVRMETTIRLHMGRYYLIKICGKKGVKYNDYVELQAGSFQKYGLTQNYSNPTLIKHPSIPDDGKIAVNMTLVGFLIMIDATCWPLAENFEVAYTAKNTTASFTDPTHTQFILNSRTVEVPTNISAEYNVAVRPLMSGQAVAKAVTATVVSGSGGRAPDERPMAMLELNHFTYSGTLGYNTTVPGTVTIEAIESPAASGRTIASMPDNIVGKIITINSVDYRITGRTSPTAFDIETLDGTNNYPSTGAGIVYTIGVSEKARQVWLTTLYYSAKFTRAEVDPKILQGGEALIRFYQKGQSPEKGDYMKVPKQGVPVEQDLNFKIVSGSGEMKLLIDLYDPDGLLNNTCIHGQLIVYGQDYFDMATTNPAI
ncbi:MAG TPA: hypothetical protein VHO03_17025 [Ignavibacteriales bacterium]|nr:hypothetical protein [Ignavibacteriales bacterium]